MNTLTPMESAAPKSSGRQSQRGMLFLALCLPGHVTALAGLPLFASSILLADELLADERRPSRGSATISGGDELFPPLPDFPSLNDDEVPGSRPSEPERGVLPRPRIRPEPRDPGTPRFPSALDPLDNDTDPDGGIRLQPLDEDAPFSPRRPSGSVRPSTGLDPDEERRVLPGENADDLTTDGAFNWSLQPVSVADIEIGKEWNFSHGKPNLSESEEDNYVELIRAALARRTLAPSQLPENANVTSAWETAFYRYAEVRRQAWENGKVQLSASLPELSDPNDKATRRVISTTDHSSDLPQIRNYSLQLDMQSHPRDFVGRPVVIYGMFTPLGPKELQARRTLEGEERVITLQRGILRNFVTQEMIAMVDAISYVDPQSQNQPSSAWPIDKRVAMPVMGKGWFVKLWQRQPLVFSDVVRVLTPRPYDEYVRDHVRSRRKVNDDESWLYHETLRQLQLTSSKVQASIAAEEQKIRVQQLLVNMVEKAGADRIVLDNQLRGGTLSKADTPGKEGYETKLRRLERQIGFRKSKYLEHQRIPETFPLFVDVFQNPDHWQGRLVTLRGHVRRVITYNGDSTLFNGQPLHELWLFTEDSQNNPAVIVTPSLPEEFPVGSELIDSVTVTGCFFKMYVYRSQQENRLAPLLLAGHVSWNPSAKHILTLAKDGHIRANSPLLAQAKSETRPISDTLVLFLGFLTLLVTMTVWGRVQRDRRERRRLLSLVDERPDFHQTSQDRFSGPFADPRIEPTRG